jgi:signal transduction histidine kinase
MGAAEIATILSYRRRVVTGSLTVLLAAGLGAGAGVALSVVLVVTRRAARDAEVGLHRLRHELRTPLASVTALTAALDGGSALDGDERRELARLAHWQAEHMADLVGTARNTGSSPRS